MSFFPNFNAAGLPGGSRLSGTDTAARTKGLRGRSGETTRNIDDLATKDCSPATQETGGYPELGIVLMGGVTRSSWGDRAAVVRNRNMSDLIQKIEAWIADRRDELEVSRHSEVVSRGRFRIPL